MKIKDCITLAAKLLNLDGVMEGDEQTQTDKLLLRCANNCLDEIASEYIPLESEMEVEAKDGMIPYSLLGETIYDVTKVTSAERGEIGFRLMNSFIAVGKDGKYTVTFRTRPGQLSAEDELPFKLLVSERTVAYGIAAEYMLVNGFYEEAVTWDTRFKDALIRAAYGSKDRRVKPRRWLI